MCHLSQCPVLLLSYLECDLNLAPCPICASVHVEVWKGFAGLFHAWKQKALQEGSLLFSPARIAQLWLMPCHFQPLNPKLSLGAGDPLLGQQNLGVDGKHRDDLSHRDPFLQKHQEWRVRWERKVLKTPKNIKGNPSSQSINHHPRAQEDALLHPSAPAPRAFLFNFPTLCFCLLQWDELFTEKINVMFKNPAGWMCFKAGGGKCEQQLWSALPWVPAAHFPLVQRLLAPSSSGQAVVSAGAG